MKIVKVKKSGDGDITDVMFDNGEVCSIQQAIEMAKRDEIEHVMVGKARNGRETLRSTPNNTEDDNLANMPLFE